VSLDRNKDLSIYPIPANSIVYLKTIDSNIKKIELINSNGEILQTQEFGFFTHESSLNLSRLQNGVYFINVLDHNNNRNSQKIVIQK